MILKCRRPFLILLFAGSALFFGGAGMRVYANVVIAQTEQRLVTARPASPAEITPSPRRFEPADGAPSMIRLPALGLWNQLTPVDELVSRAEIAWDVADAGWHVPSGWPGWGGNVVIAGHSPSRDPQTWSHSVFRQLAYLEPGTRIELTAGSRVYSYHVARVFAIHEREAEMASVAAWIERGSAERLTLITCWPPNTAAYRVLVVALPSGVDK